LILWEFLQKLRERKQFRRDRAFTSPNPMQLRWVPIERAREARRGAVPSEKGLETRL